MKYVKLFLLVAVALFAVNTATAYAETSAYRERINLEFFASKYFTINKKIDRVFVGTKDIIRVAQPANSPNEFVITAQDKKGSTTLFVWTADGERYEYLVNVVDEELGQAEIIEQAIADGIGSGKVSVKKVGDRILLTGKVKNQYERIYATKTASLYVDAGGTNNISVGANATEEGRGSGQVSLSEPIIDLLEMENPIQIRLEAQVIEINSDKAKQLGIEYYTSGNNTGIFTFGEDYTREKSYDVTEVYRTINSDGTSSFNTSGYSYDARNIPFRENPARWIEEHFSPINAQISALVTKGDAKVLSRPSITTMSSEEATIHIGGEIPYQSVNNNGASNVQFKNYGIILNFKPIVDSQGRITTAVHTEVSSIGGYTADNQPIIATRSANTVVNVYPGSTIVVGGLMDSSESKNIKKIPLLGDIPILGEFFKYTSKSRNKKELIIVVTPYFVNPEDTTHARMSDEMKDLYHAGQREMNNNTTDVDLNALPPPFDPDEKKNKKNKKSKKNKKADDVVISDYPPENTNAKSETNTNDENVEVFGNNY